MTDTVRKKASMRFDDWASTYEGSFIWRHYFVPLHDTLQERVAGVRGAAILDIGCGTGDMLRRFALAGGASLTGVDESENMLAVARELSDGADIAYLRATAESLPFPDETFDIVTSCVAFHHFPDPEASVMEMRRVLRGGGRVFIVDLADERLAGKVTLAYGRMKRADDRYFNTAGVRALLSDAGFASIGDERVRSFPPTMLVHAVK